MQTYWDTVQHLVDYLGGGLGDVVVRDCKRAIVAAQRELNAAHNWTYLYTPWRINLNGTIEDGLVTSQASGGVAPNLMTISGDVWPEWAPYSTVRIALVNYPVASVVDSLNVQIVPDFVPVPDITVPTSCIIYQDMYLLPVNFIAQDQALYETNFGGMEYVHPREWEFTNRYIFNQGIPQCFTIIGDQRFPNRLVMRILPYPTENKTLDFIYKRAPRLLSNPLLSGTAASISSLGVVGTGTSWASTLVGSVIRISGNVNLPTASNDVNPPAFEGIVQSVTDATHLTVVAYPEGQLVSASGAWTISDPIDIDEFSMLNCFLRGCEKQIGMSRTLKDKPSASKQYTEALARAKDADSRVFAGRHEGEGLRLRQRMRDMPFNMDVTN